VLRRIKIIYIYIYMYIKRERERESERVLCGTDRSVRSSRVRCIVDVVIIVLRMSRLYEMRFAAKATIGLSDQRLKLLTPVSYTTGSFYDRIISFVTSPCYFSTGALFI